MVLVKGSAAIRDFVLYDENDRLEDITGATAAKFSMKGSLSDAGPVVSKTDLTVDVANSKVRLTLGSTDLSAIPTGQYIADIAVTVSSQVYSTQPFFVDVIDKIS